MIERDDINKIKHRVIKKFNNKRRKQILKKRIQRVMHVIKKAIMQENINQKMLFDNNSTLH